MMSMMAGLSKMMAPAMLGMAVGSMVGHLATRAFGTHDLPIPRQPATVDARPVEHRQLRHRVGDPRRRDAAVGAGPRAGRSTLFSATHLRDALSGLVRQHVGGFRPDPSAVAERLGSLDSERARPDGRAAAGARRSGGAARRRHVARPSRPCGRSSTRSSPSSSGTPTGSSTPSPCASSAAARCASPRPCVAGGSRRSASDSFVEQLLGIRIGEDQVARGKAFVQGVVDRAGDDGLAPLLHRRRRHPDPERARRSRALAGAPGVIRRVGKNLAVFKGDPPAASVQLERDGYALLRGVLTTDEVSALAEEIDRAFVERPSERSRTGSRPVPVSDAQPLPDRPGRGRPPVDPRGHRAAPGRRLPRHRQHGVAEPARLRRRAVALRRRTARPPTRGRAVGRPDPVPRLRRRRARHAQDCHSSRRPDGRRAGQPPVGPVGAVRTGSTIRT